MCTLRFSRFNPLPEKSVDELMVEALLGREEASVEAFP